MVVNEYIGGFECGAIGAKAIARLKVAFDLEVEVLREVTG